MSDEVGKQLSIEEAGQDEDTKPHDSVPEEPKQLEEQGKTKVVRNTRATNKNSKEKQLPLEETVGTKKKGRGRKKV